MNVVFEKKCITVVIFRLGKGQEIAQTGFLEAKIDVTDSLPHSRTLMFLDPFSVVVDRLFFMDLWGLGAIKKQFLIVNSNFKKGKSNKHFFTHIDIESIFTKKSFSSL